jgi:flagellar hook assembly protein FlgD
VVVLALNAEQEAVLDLPVGVTGGFIGKKSGLLTNNPNPFQAGTRILYHVPEAAAGKVRLAVYGIDGRLVRTLVSGKKAHGYYSVGWDGRDQNGARVKSGVYLYRLRTGGFTVQNKMTLMQ